MEHLREDRTKTDIGIGEIDRASRAATKPSLAERMETEEMLEAILVARHVRTADDSHASSGDRPRARDLKLRAPPPLRLLSRRRGRSSAKLRRGHEEDP